MFPYALAMGMTYEQYWFDRPSLFEAYRKAEEIRTQKRNYELWLQGVYNFRAFKTVADAVMWSVGGCKGSAPESLIDHPIPITESEKEEEKQRRIEHTKQFFLQGNK